MCTLRVKNKTNKNKTNKPKKHPQKKTEKKSLLVCIRNDNIKLEKIYSGAERLRACLLHIPIIVTWCLILFFLCLCCLVHHNAEIMLMQK